MRFIVCDLITGNVMDEVPLTIGQDLTQMLRGYGEGVLNAPYLDGDGRLYRSKYWKKMIVPWRSLVLVVDDSERIIWHGIPIRANGGDEFQTAFPARTCEAYLLRRYKGTSHHLGVDKAVIFASMIAEANVSGIGMEIDAPLTGDLVERNYADSENARIYDRINDLANSGSGFDWTVDVEWADADHTRVRKIARMRPVMGNRTANPEHHFTLGGNITSVTWDNSWDDSDAATHVRAIGDGEGESRVMSSPGIDTVREAAGWPRLEDRRSFSGVKDRSTIEAHMARMKQALFGGQQLVTFTARNPRLGERITGAGDIVLGDTAKVEIRMGQDALLNEYAVEIESVWPIIGMALSPDMTTWKPTLADVRKADLDG